MQRSRPHVDIDLFVQLADFTQVERILGRTPEWVEIVRKRFSHKRAWLIGDLMVECILVGADLTSDFFDGRVVVQWPADTFASSPSEIDGIPTVSVAALAHCRSCYPEMQRARQDWGAAQEQLRA